MPRRGDGISSGDASVVMCAAGLGTQPGLARSGDHGGFLGSWWLPSREVFCQVRAPAARGLRGWGEGEWAAVMTSHMGVLAATTEFVLSVAAGPLGG